MTSTFNSQRSTDPEVVIRVENLYKEYRLGTISHGTLHHDLQSWWARMRGKEDPNSIISTIQPSTFNSSTGNSTVQPSTGISTQPSTLNSQPSVENPHFLALNDVSFEVKKGEVLGIIGRNGAGKSTLLKILSEVTSPTRGSVKIKRRVASLLEVGTGFHPELTGRENVYLNGAILGMTKKEIDNKFDEIVDFAEIEKFIDTPVKRYSSGMYVRLAFAVAAHLDPEILIVAEVLAVGDAQFQKKCLGKMGDVAKGGRTVLFVSHNMGEIHVLTIYH
jgi:lipopolysaccharide transport system ATP-binding protein